MKKHSVFNGLMVCLLIVAMLPANGPLAARAAPEPRQGLSVEFVDTAGVTPQAVALHLSGLKRAALTRVSYLNLWPGISVAYDAAESGIAKTTYTLAPGADAARIQLRYNPPVELQADGWRLVGFSGIGVHSVEFSPNYATDRMIIITAINGVHRSTDSGLTWSVVYTGSAGLGGPKFSPNYATDHTIFACSITGVYRSMDSGSTWTSTGLITESIAALAISPNYANDHTVFAGTGMNPSRVYRSTDGGATWVATGFLTDFQVRGFAISPNYANDHTIFVGIGVAWTPTSGGVYRSTDGGNTWVETNNGLTYREVGALAISPNYRNDHTLFVTGWSGGLYRTTDGGNSWVEFNDGQPNRRLSTFAFSPNYANDQIIFLGTWGEYADGGIYGSTNGGASWTAMNAGLTNHWIHRVSPSPTYSSDHLLFVGGEQGNGGGLWVYDGFSISGRLTDDSSNPISGATVSVGPSFNAPTDPGGYYTITALIPGNYTLTPAKSGYTFSPITRTIDVPPNTGGQNFVGSANQPPRFLFTWGTVGSGAGQFVGPTGVAVDHLGNVYVVDHFNHRVQKFTWNGIFIAQWGTNGSGDGQFNYPADVAIDGSDNVYVIDRDNSRVQKFTSEGIFLAKWGSLGSGNGQFNYSWGIAADDDGYVYVGDRNNNRVQKFTNAGEYVMQWGTSGSGNGQFSYPAGIGIDPSGNVYVADSLNHRIQKFTNQGGYITQWGTLGSGDGQFNEPNDVSIDNLGNVYVSDVRNYRIQKFDLEGVFLTKWGSFGAENGQFGNVVSLAANKAGNLIYACDGWSGSHERVDAFGYTALEIAPPSTAHVGDLVYIPVKLNTVLTSDDIRGVQVGIRVSNSAALTPANNQLPHIGTLFPSDSFTYTVAITNGWDFILTAPFSPTPPISGTGVMVELPFYAQSEGCVDLTFADHILTNSDAQTVNHQITAGHICLVDQGNLIGATYLQGRSTGHYQDTVVMLKGPRGTYTTTTDATGNFAINNMDSGVYTATITQPLFIKAIRQGITITGQTTTTLPEVGLWAGDMNQDGDVDEPDWYVCAAASIPVDDPAFDINDDSATNIIDCTLLGSNIGRPNMPGTNPPRTRSAAFAQAISSVTGTQPVGTVTAIPQGNGDVLLRVANVNGRIYATGTRLDLPAGASVTGVELRDGFTNGFLKWHQDNDKLYIVAAPREDTPLARDTDMVIIHISGGSGGQVIIEAQSPVGERISFSIFLPVITRR